MYEEYWNLKEKPFENTNDSRYFYYSPAHEEGLMRLIYVVREGKGGAVLIGGYGTGKTTLAKTLLTELADTGHYIFVIINNPLLEPIEFLKEITHQLGVEPPDESNRLEIKHLLEDVLYKNMSADRRSVVIIDEAHLIHNQETWEELRLLLNLQFNNRFLVSLILMGQLELSRIIGEMEQLKQRLSMRYLLNPLDAKQTEEYINHRLKVAGSNGNIFSKEATKLVYSYSKGNPREINNICDMALLVGYSKKVKTIDKDIIQEIVKDLEGGF